MSLIHWRNIHGGFAALIGLYSQVAAARRKHNTQPKAVAARHGDPLLLYVSVSPVFCCGEDLRCLTSQSLHKECWGNTGATQCEESFPTSAIVSSEGCWLVGIRRCEEWSRYPFQTEQTGGD